MKETSVRSARLTGLYAAMLLDGLCVSGAALVVPLVREQYGADYALAGLLLAFLSVGNLVAALLSGFLPRVWGVRLTALTLVFGLPAGYLLLLMSGSPAVLLLSFLLVGFGKGSSMNNAVVLTGAACDDHTKSTNLINALFAVGSLVVPALFWLCAPSAYWGAPVLALAAAGGVLWVLFARTPMPGRTAARAARDDLSFLRDRHFWYTTAFLFCQHRTEISVTSWLVTYFEDTGILAGSLSDLTVTVVWTAMLTARLLIAFVLKPASRLRSLTLMSVASAVTYLLLLFAGSGAAALGALFLFGFSIAGTYPTAIAKASGAMSNASVGVLLPVAGVGAIVMPYITGAVAQAVGIHGGMMCPLATLAGMLVFSVLMRRAERTAPEAAA